jgi:hypothetical protein
MFLAVAMAAAMASCWSDESPVVPGNEADILQWEAERAVRILGHDPAAAPLLVGRIGRDIARIRAMYGDRFHFDGHRVHYPFNPRLLDVTLTEEGRRKWYSGDWPELAAALEAMGAAGTGSYCGGPAVVFDDAVSPCVIGAWLERIDGVSDTGPAWWNLVCDDPCGFIWPIPDGTGMDYLFEYRFDGDEDSEPEPRTYYYFHANLQGGIELLGSYLPGVYPTPDDDEKPFWWRTVSEIYSYYDCTP